MFIISAMVVLAAAAVEPGFDDCQAESSEHLSLLQRVAMVKKKNESNCDELFLGSENCNYTTEEFSKFESRRAAFEDCCHLLGHPSSTCHSVGEEVFRHDDDVSDDECDELKDLKQAQFSWLADQAEQDLKAALPGRRRRNGDFPGACFPGDARLLVFESGKLVWSTMRAVLPGQKIFVGNRGGVGLVEPVLLEVHSASAHQAQGIEFLRITHEEGILDVTAGHYVKSVEAGMVPAEKIAVGSHVWSLSAALANQSDIAIDDVVLSPSRVLSLHVVYRTGFFNKLTYSGRVVVDGVLFSSYTVVEGKTYVPSASAQDALIEAFGYDGLERLEHVVSLPLRIIHTYAPISWRSSSFWSPHEDNMEKTVDGSDLPLYIDFVGRIGGPLLQVLAPLIAMPKLWGRAIKDSAAVCQGEAIERMKADSCKNRLIDKLL